MARPIWAKPGRAGPRSVRANSSPAQSLALPQPHAPLYFPIPAASLPSPSCSGVWKKKKENKDKNILKIIIPLAFTITHNVLLKKINYGVFLAHGGLRIDTDLILGISYIHSPEPGAISKRRARSMCATGCGLPTKEN